MRRRWRRRRRSVLISRCSCCRLIWRRRMRLLWRCRMRIWRRMRFG
ncbi:MAG: hypothetical protein FWH37_10090 [Candidatus Bathyarchaeota archaeon]|nr:hypothetical protein [Candidatus Termiticorpusculum sp.]